MNSIWNDFYSSFFVHSDNLRKYLINSLTNPVTTWGISRHKIMFYIFFRGKFGKFLAWIILPIIWYYHLGVFVSLASFCKVFNYGLASNVRSNINFCDSWVDICKTNKVAFISTLFDFEFFKFKGTEYVGAYYFPQPIWFYFNFKIILSSFFFVIFTLLQFNNTSLMTFWMLFIL